MRILVIITVVFSFQALAQTRVRENIKQQSVAVSEDASIRPVAPPKKMIKPVKPVKSR